MIIPNSLKNKQAGVGLIEVLVALLVLSVGFLVSANMQLKGMNSNQDSYYQSQALMLANDMMDRMRNNRAGVLAGQYNNMQTTDSVTKPNCASSGCNASDLATLDRFEWSANLHPLRNEDADSFIPALPLSSEGDSATGTVSTPTGGVYTITMSWQRIVDGVEAEQTLVVRFVP